MKKILSILMFIFMLIGITFVIAGALVFNQYFQISGILLFCIGALLHDLGGKQ